MQATSAFSTDVREEAARLLISTLLLAWASEDQTSVEEMALRTSVIGSVVAGQANASVETKQCIAALLEEQKQVILAIAEGMSIKSDSDGVEVTMAGPWQADKGSNSNG